MFDPIVTIFERVTDVQNPVHRKLSKVINHFKTDLKLQERIAKLQNLNGEDYDKAKKDLPVVCFGGQFENRSNKGLLLASGLMVLDFDDKDIKEYKELQGRLKRDPYILCYFTSPSGQGFKALVKIPVVKNDAEYKTYYFSFMERYKELDTSGKDISRACFYSFDSEALINYNAKTWDKQYKEKEAPLKFNTSKKVYSDYKILSRICNVIRNAVKGERNTKIYNAAMLAGGYIASGQLEYDVALAALEKEANACAPDEMRQNPKTILNGIQNGMTKPLKELQEIEKVETIEERLGKIYYSILDVQDELDDLFENGVQRGATLGFSELDQHYTVKLGSTTYVYGAPYSGKSQFWFECLIKLSIQHNWKHAVFSPETGSVAEVYAELIQMHAQQDFYGDYGNKMDVDTYQRSKDWVHKHFIVVDGGDEMMTLIDFYDVIDIVERVYGVKIQTTTIDPFNDFKHDFKQFNNRQDIYIEAMLTFIRQNARRNERHNCVITHVQDQQIITDKSSGLRYYPQASYREIAGGQAWSRKGMAMLSVYRPKEGMTDEHGIPVKNNESWIEIQKAKPKGIGKTGKVVLFYDAKKHRYFDKDFEF